MRESGAEELREGIQPGCAYRLEDLVQTAVGSIVSRTVLDEDDARLTFFAFDKGQQLSQHTVPYDAYAIILEGEAELTIGGETVLADGGQMVLMPAGVPHAVRAPEPFKMMLVMLRA